MKRSKRIELLVSDEDLKQARELAENTGSNVSAIIRALIRQAYAKMQRSKAVTT